MPTKYYKWSITRIELLTEISVPSIVIMIPSIHPNGYVNFCPKHCLLSHFFNINLCHLFLWKIVFLIWYYNIFNHIKYSSTFIFLNNITKKIQIIFSSHLKYYKSFSNFFLNIRWIKYEFFKHQEVKI